MSLVISSSRTCPRPSLSDPARACGAYDAGGVCASGHPVGEDEWVPEMATVGDSDIGDYDCLTNCASFIGPVIYYVDRNCEDAHQSVEVYQRRGLYDVNPMGGPFGSLDQARDFLYARYGGVGHAPESWAAWINNESDCAPRAPVAEAPVSAREVARLAKGRETRYIVSFVTWQSGPQCYFAVGKTTRFGAEVISHEAAFDEEDLAVGYAETMNANVPQSYSQRARREQRAHRAQFATFGGFPVFAKPVPGKQMCYYAVVHPRSASDAVCAHVAVPTADPDDECPF